MAEAQVLDRPRLDRRDVLVDLVGTKRRAYDGAGSTASLGKVTWHVTSSLLMPTAFAIMSCTP